MHRKHPFGFSVPELLIVIVVIGILSTIVAISYSGIQDRARDSKMRTDLKELQSAIEIARSKKATTLFGITNDDSTAWTCTQHPSGIDLATLAKTDGCWISYSSTLDAISNASGKDVRSLVDAWGRPYFIDENENENNLGSCNKDVVGVYKNPFVFDDWNPVHSRELSNVMSGC
jgi:prepilin-type N-terminal cleavage/methylation domain-containing protein